MEYQFRGINSALQTLCREILDKGVWRETRGFKCLEFPEPVLIKITDPTSRWCTIKERKWVMSLPYAEGLWIASGRNDMELPGSYVKNLYTYSDDQKYMRAAYGTRIRRYNGISEDYEIGKDFIGYDGGIEQVDQFDFVEKSFKRDTNTRQAGITIHDVMKDSFNEDGSVKTSKDFPCTRTLQLQMSTEGKLNFTTTMRSNDLIFGFGHINLFNFSFMQEYWSSILTIPVGQYYHFANNFHIYEDKLEMVKSIAEAQDYEDESYEYEKTFNSLTEFDSMLKKLEDLEEELRKNSYDSGFRFEDPFFSDWHNIFIWKWMKNNYEFHNHIITNIIESK